MKRLTAILVPLVAFASSAVAANTPEVLVQELAQAAHNGDERGFLSNMSVETQRAMADADAAGSKLTQAQKDVQAALDEHFGTGVPCRSEQPRIADRKTVLSRLVNIELIGVEHKTPTEARLRLKTTSKGGGDQTTSEEDTLPAVKEGDDWKLELTDVTQAITEMLDKRAALYSQVATGVRSGAFKDRISAMLALAETQRGAGGKDN